LRAQAGGLAGAGLDGKTRIVGIDDQAECSSNGEQRRDCGRDRIFSPA
jgi:hypothetical protein